MSGPRFLASMELEEGKRCAAARTTKGRKENIVLDDDDDGLKNDCEDGESE